MLEKKIVLEQVIVLEPVMQHALTCRALETPAHINALYLTTHFI